MPGRGHEIYMRHRVKQCYHWDHNPGLILKPSFSTGYLSWCLRQWPWHPVPWTAHTLLLVLRTHLWSSYVAPIVQVRIQAQRSGAWKQVQLINLRTSIWPQALSPFTFQLLSILPQVCQTIIFKGSSPFWGSTHHKAIHMKAIFWAPFPSQSLYPSPTPRPGIHKPEQMKSLTFWSLSWKKF